jgi:hypothetical protein
MMRKTTLVWATRVVFQMSTTETLKANLTTIIHIIHTGILVTSKQPIVSTHIVRVVLLLTIAELFKLRGELIFRTHFWPHGLRLPSFFGCGGTYDISVQGGSIIIGGIMALLAE